MAVDGLESKLSLSLLSGERDFLAGVDLLDDPLGRETPSADYDSEGSDEAGRALAYIGIRSVAFVARGRSAESTDQGQAEAHHSELGFLAVAEQQAGNRNYWGSSGKKART